MLKRTAYLVGNFIGNSLTEPVGKGGNTMTPWSRRHQVDVPLTTRQGSPLGQHSRKGGGRGRPLESMHGEEARRKKRQRVKMLWNIHNALETSRRVKEVTPCVVGGMSHDGVYGFAERRQQLAHHIVLTLLGCQHVRGWRRDSRRVIGVGSHCPEPGLREGGTVGGRGYAGYWEGGEPKGYGGWGALHTAEPTGEA